MTRIPSWKLERLHLGELEDPALEARARAELEELSRSDAEILAAHPPERVAAEVERRRRVEAARASLAAPRRGLFVLLPVSALAVAAALTLLPRQHDRVGDASDQAPEIIVTKGAAAVRVYRRTDAGAEPLANRAEAHARDRLQIATIGGSDRFGVVVSVDGRGAVTLHFPASEEGSTALAGKETPLPSSYELDDAPAFERFFLVSGSSPVAVGAVLAAARELAASGRAAEAPLALPGELHQTSLLLRKVQP